MKLPQLVNRKWIYTALSFAIPFVGMLIVMIVGGCKPFGTNSMLYSDMYHQYYPFFKTFRSALLSGDSLLYNWNIGMGIDFLGLYSYYLASPLNLLSILVPEQWVLEYFCLLVPIKLGLASMFFGIFLQKIFQKNDLSVSLFGSFYGLCAWALGYQWNVMWLDTFALLPLVMLGMVSLLKDKKFVLYTITLFLSVAINYYIGLFTCIFVLLSFICYEICRFKGLRALWNDLLRIATFSIIAIGMTAIITLPTLAALQNTQSSVNTFPKGFYLNMTDEENLLGLLKTMLKVAGNMNGGISPSFKEGLPNLYCGVFTIVFAFLYLLCGQVRLRDRLCTAFLLLLFNVSFIIRQLDYIWHGFHFTNMIPFRFSFLYSFVMLYMAYSAWVNRKHFRLWQVIVAAVAATGIMFCHLDFTNELFWVYNSVLLILYAGILIYHSTLRTAPTEDENAQKNIQLRPMLQGICSLVLLGVIAVEVILNVANFSSQFPLTNTTDYPKGTDSTATVLEHMESLESEDSFYRAEVTHAQTLNDGALNGYYGISAFTSSANVHVTEFMKALGYGALNTYNRYCFEESSPVANLFLGLKYMIERDDKVEENPYFSKIFSERTVHLLENNAYLPLGFLANPQLLNVDFNSDGNMFAFQNELIRQAAGLEQDVWYILPGTALTIGGNCPLVTPQPATGYCSYATKEETGTVTYSYTADREGLVCINLNLSKHNNFSVWLNGDKLYNETYSLPQMLSVCTVRPGDVFEIKLACKANEVGNSTISAAILNETYFRQAYDTLAASTLELTKFSNTQLEGSIICDRDGVLYTSIPQNGNWVAYVDGKETDTVLIGDAMMGLLLTEGDHTIRFVYRNEAFSLGCKITLVFFLVFIGIYWVQYKPSIRRYKGRFLK